MPVTDTQRKIAERVADLGPFEIASEFDAIRSEFRAAGEALFGHFVAKLFAEFPDLHHVHVRGWTPGFNDGDPCVHSQDVFVTLDDFTQYEEHDEHYTYISGDENTRGHYELNNPEDPEVITLFNTNLDTAVSQQIAKGFHAFAGPLEAIYETNWQIDFRRDESGVGFTTSRDEYDCGY